MQTWRATGHEPRLRAPHPTEPALPVPPRPVPPPPAPAWPGPAVPDSRSAPRRDDYDKKVKQAAKEKARRRHTPAPTRPRRPDLQVYLPRHRGEAAHPPASSSPRALLALAQPQCTLLSCMGKSYFLAPKAQFISSLLGTSTSCPQSPLVILPVEQRGLKLSIAITGQTWESARSCLSLSLHHTIFVFLSPNRK